MPITTQMGDLTATFNGHGVEVDGPGTAALSMDSSGNVTTATLDSADPAYQRMVAYGLRVLSGVITS